MICLSMEDVSLHFGATELFNRVTFSIADGDRLGIVGVNGAGKSSLLKLMTGEYAPTSGNRYLAKNKTVGYLEQNALEKKLADEESDGGGTVEEAMLEVCADLLETEKQLELLQALAEKGDTEAAGRFAELHERFTGDGGYSFRGRCKGLLHSLGFIGQDTQKPLRCLSGGERTRLALGRLLFSEPDLLLLDEPTNHLDRKTLEWLENYLASYRKTVVVVSHDRFFLDRVATKILDLEYGRGRLYTGNYSAFVEKKRADRQIAERHYENQQREIARIEAYIANQRRWNRERNIIAAESRQKMLDRMEKLDKPEKEPESVRLFFRQSVPSGEEVLTVKELSKRFGDKTLFTGLSFTVNRGDRLLILGDNGCGKSTLLKILTAVLPPDSGGFRFGYQVDAGYYDQENARLCRDATVLEELWESFSALTQREVRRALAGLGFTGDEVQKKVGMLSGGERARLTLAKLMLSKTNLLLLDEPTNHLDIPTREVLEEALSSYEGTVIAVSHDRYFIKKLATKLLDFGGGRGARPFFFVGTYEEYLDYLERIAETPAGAAPTFGAAAPPPPLSAAKRQYLQNKQTAAEKRRLQNRLREAEQKSGEIERALEEIAVQSEEHASDHLLLTALYEKQTAMEETLLQLYEECDKLKTQLLKMEEEKKETDGEK